MNESVNPIVEHESLTADPTVFAVVVAVPFNFTQHITVDDLALRART